MPFWSVEHRVFAVEQFLRNNESIVAVTRAFRCHFNVPHRGAVPYRDLILEWVRKFRETGVHVHRLGTRLDLEQQEHRRMWNVLGLTLRMHRPRRKSFDGHH